MEYRELKGEVLKEIVRCGANSIGDLRPQSVENIPDKYVNRWFRQMNEKVPVEGVPTNPRLLNRFTIGADPEFCFNQLTGPVEAHALGLHAGLAFGMDINGRLAELRPAPSRFALDVVASILTELRWMAQFHPNTLQYGWVSTPFNGNDGIGGHVHFARKRPIEDHRRDVHTLDGVFYWLQMAGVYDLQGTKDRARHTKYGRQGDYRFQKHGYEYRSLPTWLENPWMAYLTLVISKLALIDPSMIRDLCRTQDRWGDKLHRFLEYYHSQDDDANIALHALSRWGLPRQTKNDFKGNWGILYGLTRPNPNVQHIPSMIEGTQMDKQDVLDYLVSGVPIKPNLPAPNWTPTVYPENYKSLFAFTNTYRRVGIGEICVDLVCHEGIPVIVQPRESNHMSTIQIPTSLGPKKIESTWREIVNLNGDELLELQPHSKNTVILSISTGVRENNGIGLVRKFLTSGVLPVWKVSEVRVGCYDEWTQGQLVSNKKASKLKGQQLQGG